MARRGAGVGQHARQPVVKERHGGFCVQFRRPIRGVVVFVERGGRRKVPEQPFLRSILRVTCKSSVNYMCLTLVDLLNTETPKSFVAEVMRA